MAKSKGPGPRRLDEVRCCSSDCCGPESACCMPASGCCQVDAVVSVDGRGQMVLPKEVREKFGIKPGDKLAVVSWTRDGETCCLTLNRANDLAEAVRNAYGPILKDLLRG
jgi:antitoxin PrlF